VTIGAYYNKDIFSELGLEPPKTWEEFENVIVTLKDNGVTPFVTAGQDSWPLDHYFYALAHLTTPYEEIEKVHVPVLVLRARTRDPDEHQIMDFSKSPTWPELAGEFEQGEDVYLPWLTHFIPMQDPAMTAAFIRGERPDQD
jgi:hypothetical protein